jgi:hypothetical protein
MRMQEFYKEVDDNINVNRTFSIHDITDEDRLHQFYVIGEDVEISNLLEDSEFLMDSSDKVIDKIEASLARTEIDTVNSSVTTNNNNITTEITENDEETNVNQSKDA